MEAPLKVEVTRKALGDAVRAALRSARPEKIQASGGLSAGTLGELIYVHFNQDTDTFEMRFTEKGN